MKKRHSVVIVIYVVLTSVAIVIIALVSWVYNLFVGKMQYGKEKVYYECKESKGDV